MFRTFHAETADKLWHDVAEALRQRGGQEQSSRAGSTREILHAALSIGDSRQRWIYSRQPALNLAFALAEVVWIIRGRNDSAFLNYFNRQLPRFAGEGPTYHGAYGQRLRSTFGLDQFESAYSALRNNAHSRQVVLQIWDPRQDFPDHLGREVAKDVPCNVSALLKVRDKQLEWVQIMRSNDLHRGLPHNVVQFTSLQEIIAGWLGIEPAGYHHVSDSLHVYLESENEFSILESGMAAPPNTDNLAIPKAQSDQAFAVLEQSIDRIISQDVSSEEVCKLLSASLSLPPAFQNMLCVFCAEGVRKRGRRDIAETIMLDCSNPAFTWLYNAWLDRVAHRRGV